MKLMVTGPWDEARIARVQAAFPNVTFAMAKTPAEQQQAIVDADAVFGWVSRDVFNAAKKLRWIQSPSAGVEWTAHIPELLDSKVVICNTSGAHGPTIAEHTFGMLIHLARQFGPLLKSQAAKDWQRPLRVAPIGIGGMTLGIVGLGNIGRAIAKIGHAFDMNVIAVDMQAVAKPNTVAELGQLDKLPDLMRRSDAVVVTVPYTAQTKGMLGPNELRLMKPTAYLLVISRGGLIDEPTVIDMLKSGKLAGCGLDVQASEPMPDNDPLWDAPNLILTPHCSAISNHTLETATDIFADNLKRFVAGEPLTHVIDVRRGF